VAVRLGPVLEARRVGRGAEGPRRCVEPPVGGARRYKEPEDHGLMYGWGFEDLDGHLWEFLWMDPAAPQGPHA